MTVSNTKGTASKLYTFIVLPARRVDGQFILTETQITKSEEHPGTYAIYGDRIVWTDWRNGWYNNYDIYMYDLSTYKETQITTSKSNQMEPAIYGDRIVWMDDRNGGGREYGQYVGNWDIYMYDLSTHKETQITTNESNQMEPAIYGDRIVWTDGRNGGGWENVRLTGNWDIYLYDLSTSTEYQITTNNAMQSFPAIYGDRIVWEDNRSENWNIYMYDLSTHQEFQITTNLSYQQEPEIYEDKIVWVDHRSGIGNIYMYNISTSKETQITNKLSHSLPMGLDIYNDRIVYTNHSDQNIYMYDLSTSIETQITTSKSYLGYPKIFSDKILWTDYCNGSDDIYMCTISEKWQERKLPVANFSATPTSGNSPLYVHFTDLSDNATERNWDFENDGIVDFTDKNPVHVYTVPGNYTVILTAVNENGITSKMAYLFARSISV